MSLPSAAQDTHRPEVDSLITQWKDRPGNLIMVLHEIEKSLGYVPRDISKQLARGLNIPLAQIYEVLTFYNYFRLTPPAKNKIQVCMGTACYIKGSGDILESLKAQLGVNEGEITPDGQFEIENVRCIGCCGLSPVIKVGDKVFGKVKPDDVTAILSDYTA